MPPRVGLRSDPMEYYNRRPHHAALKRNKSQNSCVCRLHYDHPAGALPTCHQKELQNTLQAVDNWCERNSLVITKDKTALMPMFAKNKEEIINHPIVRERKIKIVTQIKYLGVILDSKLDWYPHTLYLE